MPDLKFDFHALALKAQAFGAEYVADYPTALTAMQAFKIEIFANGEWTDDASLLGNGCNQNDNLWPTESAALAACEDLALVGFDRSELRVIHA
jgi:hypothetical protein